jgi:beta-lactamase regulating signal transducer with metallopeptidase domain/protocatechuate 3,4-dioxygenase beta subunit
MNETVSTSADAALRYLLAGSIAAVILVPLAWLVIRTIRLRMPVYRHTIWLYCLIGTVALPAVWLYGPRLTLPVLPARAQPGEASPLPRTPPERIQPSAVPAVPQTRAPIAVPPMPEPPAAAVMRTAPHSPVAAVTRISWRVAVAGAWLAGFAAMLLRLLVGWRRLRDLYRSAVPIEPDELAGDLSRPRFESRLAEQLPGPVCFGILRPAILLPRRMYENASAKDLRMVLAHEVAHLERGDCWVNLFQRLLEALFFFHGLIWLASRQLTHERERICDNWVLAGGAGVEEYLQLLTDIGERITMKTRYIPTVALFEGGLLSRARSLLDPQHNCVTHMTRRSAWTCAVSFLLCFAALGTVRLGARPNSAASVVPATAATRTGRGLSRVASADPTFRPQEEHLGPTERRPSGNCSLSGRVVSDATGEPVGHAHVYLFSADTHDAIFIDVASDGSFLFKDIAAGSYTLRTINTGGYQDVSYNPEGRTDNFPQFTLHEAEQRTDLVLKARPACRIAGTVLDENGQPWRGGELSVVAWQEKEKIDSIGHRFVIVARTPGALTGGAYALDGLDARPTYVMAIDNSSQDKDDYYPPCYHPGTLDRNQAKMVRFDAAYAAENIDIRLRKRGEYALEGTITDESTGRPIEKALVAVHRTDMLFDDVTAYTNAQGHYRIDSLGPGEFLVHVDAKPFGFVRARQPVAIPQEMKKSRVDFALRPGVTIRGKFVDTAGKDVEFTEPAYGFAYHQPTSNRQSGSWTGRANRYSVAERKGYVAFTGGAGDYESEQMDFPTPSTFVIEGMLPGQTSLNFEPKASDLAVQAILYQGQEVRWTGFDTGADREIRDVTVVITRPVPPPGRP